MAGEPMRTPPGVRADTSPTTAFLFRVTWQMSQAFSTLDPVSPSGRRSHSTRWLSAGWVGGWVGGRAGGWAGGWAGWTGSARRRESLEASGRCSYISVTPLR